ncbi:FAD-binding oxidoreductase [uncultured Friedmanniella sp.]|uniref:FAD-binding oxidoreductase n=1 Tax=uncultured Friedmanniella sp. TaxID=335381 RepID=UPI0035CCA596
MTTSLDVPAVLPPGTSAATLAEALTRFAAVVGEAHVRRAEAAGDYTDPYAFGDGVGSVPGGVVRPGSVEEVQAVVRVAAERSVPLWTVSRGRNLAYGGASPRVPGSVVLDLSRMNRVLEVDEEAGYARVEPGVSFADLHAHLRTLGSSLWMSVPELSWGSVLGNALERGFGYTVGGDHSAHMCGLEVVLADGSLLRTGMGAMAGNRAWSLYKGGFGPSLDGLFLQSNYGVVTSMGIWLHPAPETALMMSVAVPGFDDLGPLVDTLRPFLLDGTIRSTASIGSVLALASAITERQQWYDGPGAMPEPVVAKLQAVFGVGRWNGRVGLYGNEEVVAAQAKLVRRACERIPGAEVGVRSYPGSPTDDLHPADRTLLGVPSTDMVRMAGWAGGDPAHIDFSLVCPPNGADALAQMRLIRRRVNEYGFDHVGGLTLFGRHAVTLALLSFDRADPERRASVQEVFPRLVADAAAQGYAPYRAHVAFMDLIAEQYGWGDHAARRLQQRIKDAVDPIGILSPGKQGIWPSRHPDRTAEVGEQPLHRP